MTLALPPALRRTGSKAAPGAERLTFHREHAAQLVALDEGALVSLPNGERFEVLDTTTDMTGRPTLVVRSATHHEKEAMTATATDQPTELATVEVSVESSLAAADGSGGLGRVSVSVPLAPKPDSIAQGLGVSGLELALTYTQPADVEAIEAAAEASGEPFFSVPGIPGVMKLTGKEQTANGHAFRAINGSRILGDETLRRRQVAQNRAYDAGKIAAQNAEAERRASDTGRQERFAAVEDAYSALHWDEKLGFLASKVQGLEPTALFKVTNPAARGLT